MKLRDKIKIGTDDEVKKNLDSIVRLILAKSLEIKPKDKFDTIAEIVRRTSLYAALQLRMMIDLYDLPIECKAWISRNLFELNLILEYSLKFPDRAKEFALQKGSDEKEILEGILNLNSAESSDAEKNIKMRINHLESVLRKHSNKKIKHFSVSQMAEQTGMKQEYETFFKLYSKYVHPSSWLIFAAENEKANNMYQNVFIIQAQYYASRILKICEDYK